MRHKNQLMLLATTVLMSITSISASNADEKWRKENPVFLIGVARDSSAPRTAQQYERFRQVIEQAIDMPVEVFVAANLASLIDAHASGRVDYAPMTLLGYYTTDALCDCTEPLVAPSTQDGAIGIRSVLLTKAGSADTVEQLADKTVAYGPPTSLPGAMVPKVTFRFIGQPLEQADLSLVETSSFEETLALLDAGKVDAAFGWAYAGPQTTASLDDGFAKRAKQTFDIELVSLWESRPVPFGPHVVAREIPDEIKRELKAAMISLHTDHPLAFDEISPQLAGPMRAVNAFDYREALSIIERAQR